MGFDLALAERMRQALDELRLPGLAAKEMFGGVGFMIRGNMACGVHRERAIVRVGPDRYQDALGEPGVQVFDITGRPMRGWVMVDGVACETDEALREWVALGVAFALSLPGK